MVHGCRSGSSDVHSGTLSMLVSNGHPSVLLAGSSLSYDGRPASLTPGGCWSICLNQSVGGFGYLSIRDSDTTSQKMILSSKELLYEELFFQH